jgi:hypothetical protein
MPGEVRAEGQFELPHGEAPSGGRLDHRLSVDDPTKRGQEKSPADGHLLTSYNKYIY